MRLQTSRHLSALTDRKQEHTFTMTQRVITSGDETEYWPRLQTKSTSFFLGLIKWVCDAAFFSIDVKDASLLLPVPEDTGVVTHGSSIYSLHLH